MVHAKVTRSHTELEVARDWPCSTETRGVICARLGHPEAPYLEAAMRFWLSAALIIGVGTASVVGGCLPSAPSDGFDWGGAGGTPPSRTSGNGDTTSGSKAATTGSGTTSSTHASVGATTSVSNGATTTSTSGSGTTTAATTTSAASGGGNGTPTTCAQANDFYGCCDPSGTLYYCDQSTLQSLQCSSGTECGWNDTQGYYDCVASPGGADPSGAHPMTCGGSGGSTSSSSSTTSSSTSSSTTSSSSSGGGTGVTWTQIYNGMFGLPHVFEGRLRVRHNQDRLL
jgi:hypothetical protein